MEVNPTKLVELGQELLPHSSYFPVIGLYNFSLFLAWKKSLAEQKSESNEKVIAVTKVYIPGSNVSTQKKIVSSY